MQRMHEKANRGWRSTAVRVLCVLSVVLNLVCASAYARMKNSQKKVVILSTPEGANVSLEGGRQLGSAPLVYVAPATAPLRLRFEKFGYESMVIEKGKKG